MMESDSNVIRTVRQLSVFFFYGCPLFPVILVVTDIKASVTRSNLNSNARRIQTNQRK